MAVYSSLKGIGSKHRLKATILTEDCHMRCALRIAALAAGARGCGNARFQAK